MSSDHRGLPFSDGDANTIEDFLALSLSNGTQYVEQKSNEHQKNMRNTVTALK